MARTGRVEYDGRVVIIIGVDMTVCVVASTSFIIIIIIIVVIILSRDVFLISLAFIWTGIRDFKSQSVKDFQSDRGSPREPPCRLANKSGEQQGGLREAGEYASSVEVD